MTCNDAPAWMLVCTADAYTLEAIIAEDASSPLSLDVPLLVIGLDLVDEIEVVRRYSAHVANFEHHDPFVYMVRQSALLKFDEYDDVVGPTFAELEDLGPNLFRLPQESRA